MYNLLNCLYYLFHILLRSSVLCCLFYLPVTHATPAYAQELHKNGFIYCVSGIVNTFNPQLVSGGVAVNTLSTQLYDQLLDVDPYTYRLLPEVAKSWEILDDGKTYRFHLRKNIPFQQTPWFTPTRTLDADDVLFSFLRIFDRQHPYHSVNGGRYPYFDSLQLADNVKSITKRDQYTVEIRLITPDSSFLWHLATHYAPVLSAEYAEKLSLKGKKEQLDQLPVGSGPYLLKEHRIGQFVRLVRNDSYWRGSPYMEQAVVDLSVGGTGRLSKLITGECDILAYPAASQLSVLRHDPRLSLHQRPGMNMAYLAFNTRRPPLNDLRVRQAISLAINNLRLMESIYYGSAETAASLLPRASWAYDGEAEITAYDPEQAKLLLKQANIQQLTLQLLVPTMSQSYNPSPLKTAELLQADLAQVGISVDIIPVEARTLEASSENGKYDLTLTGWSTDSADPDSFLRSLLSCAAIDSQTNYAYWCNPAFDKSLQQARLTHSLTQRTTFYQQAQKILAKELPVLPLAASLHLQANRHDIKGLTLSPFGVSSFASIQREAENSNSKGEE